MGMRELLESTKVRDTNIRPPVTVPKSATIRDTVLAMRSAKLGCAVVIDDDSAAIGMFTEGILRHCLNESPSVLDDCVTTQMVTRLPWVSVNEPVSVVLDAMEDNNIRFLAILDDQRRVTGVTGQKSFMEFVADTFPEEILTQDPTSVSYSSNKEGA